MASSFPVKVGLNPTQQLSRHQYSSGTWLGVNLKWTPKSHMVQIDQTACSKYANHSKFDSQHDRGGLSNCILYTGTSLQY